MGGEIGVDSKQNCGSNFWFKLMLPVAEGDAVYSKNSSLAGLKLLIVEASNTQREILRYYADSWAMQVDATDSGNEGLVLLEQAVQPREHDAMIVVGEKLADMGGKTFCQTVEAESRIANAPMILLTLPLSSQWWPGRNQARPVRSVVWRSLSEKSIFFRVCCNAQKRPFKNP